MNNKPQNKVYWILEKNCVSFVNNKQQILLWIIAPTILYLLMLILDWVSFTLKHFYIVFSEGKMI